MAIIGTIARAGARLLSKTRIGQRVISKVAPRLAKFTPVSQVMSRAQQIIRSAPKLNIPRISLPRLSKPSISGVTKPLTLGQRIVKGGKSLAGLTALTVGATLLGGKIAGKIQGIGGANVDTMGYPSGSTESLGASAPIPSMEAPMAIDMSTIGKIAGGAGLLYAGEQLAERLGVRGGAGFVGARQYGRHRGMKVTNIRALRRATRRLSGFNKMASKVYKELSKISGVRKPSRHKRDTLNANEIMLASMLRR